MQEMLEIQIRERAYQIWMANGCINGEADRHWLTAEQEVTATAAPPTGKPTKAAPRRTTAAKARKMS